MGAVVEFQATLPSLVFYFFHNFLVNILNIHVKFSPMFDPKLKYIWNSSYSQKLLMKIFSIMSYAEVC
jgi:hypothetical protein